MSAASSRADTRFSKIGIMSAGAGTRTHCLSFNLQTRPSLRLLFSAWMLPGCAGIPSRPPRAGPWRRPTAPCPPEQSNIQNHIENPNHQHRQERRLNRIVPPSNGQHFCAPVKREKGVREMEQSCLCWYLCAHEPLLPLECQLDRVPLRQAHRVGCDTHIHRDNKLSN